MEGALFLLVLLVSLGGTFALYLAIDSETKNPTTMAREEAESMAREEAERRARKLGRKRDDDR